MAPQFRVKLRSGRVEPGGQHYLRDPLPGLCNITDRILLVDCVVGQVGLSPTRPSPSRVTVRVVWGEVDTLRAVSHQPFDGLGPQEETLRVVTNMSRETEVIRTAAGWRISRCARLRCDFANTTRRALKAVGVPGAHLSPQFSRWGSPSLCLGFRCASEGPRCSPPAHSQPDVSGPTYMY